MVTPSLYTSLSRIGGNKLFYKMPDKHQMAKVQNQCRIKWVHLLLISDKLKKKLWLWSPSPGTVRVVAFIWEDSDGSRYFFIFVRLCTGIRWIDIKIPYLISTSLNELEVCQYLWCTPCYMFTLCEITKKHVQTNIHIHVHLYVLVDQGIFLIGVSKFSPEHIDIWYIDILIM